MTKYKVLSTKKLEPSRVELAAESNIEIIEQEAIKVRSILTKEKWNEIFQIIEGKEEFVAFTSSNAVLAVKKYLNDYINPFEINWKIFSLSGKTKEILEQEGKLFGNIIDTAENSRELAHRIVVNQVKEVVFFCGDKRRDELPDVLKAAGINVHEVIVYETIETPVILSNDIDAVLFFSPSAVQSFFSVNQLKKHTVCFAIGETTASSISSFTENKIIVSEAPSQEMVLASVTCYFQNINCYE